MDVAAHRAVPGCDTEPMTTTSTEPDIGTRPFVAVVGVALVAQLLVRYVTQSASLQVGGFYWATALIRLAVPAAGAVALGLSARRIGLGRPRVPRRDLAPLAVAAAIGLVVAILALQADSYNDAYGIDRVAAGFGAKFRIWALFTLSTTVTWEVFHRGFLLPGLRFTLERAAVPVAAATTVAVAVVACFEVLYHVSKPALEPVALLVGSPLLSLLALRYRSLWIPLLVHVAVEGLWFAFVWF